MLGALVRRTAASVLKANSIRTRALHLSVLPDAVDRNSEAFVRNSQVMQGLVSELQSHIQKVNIPHSLCLSLYFLFLFFYFYSEMACVDVIFAGGLLGLRFLVEVENRL